MAELLVNCLQVFNGCILEKPLKDMVNDYPQVMPVFGQIGIGLGVMVDLPATCPAITSNH
jgi:hypothetical protein